MQVGDLLARATAQRGIKVRQRLVEHEYLRILDDGTADCDALPLATRQLAGQAMQQVPDLQHACHGVDAALDFRALGADILQAEGDVAAYRHVRVERVALKHHGDAALARRQMIHARPVDLDLAGIDRLQAGDHSQQGGFSAAGRA